MSTPLSRPPTIQTTDGYAVQRRRGGVRVRRLGVVDPADAVGHGHRRDAVRVEPEVGEGVVDDVGRRPRRRGRGRWRRGCWRRRAARRGRRPTSSGTVVSSMALLRRSSRKARSQRMPSTTPKSLGPGTPRSKPMARAPSDDLGLLDHALGGLVGLVVDAGDPGVRVDRRLRVAVGLEGAVPVEVVVGDVQADAPSAARGRRGRCDAGGAAGSSRARRRARPSPAGRGWRRAPGCRCCRTARRACRPRRASWP